MENLILTTAILLCAVPNAHARDAALEAAGVMFYDKNCAKLPANFVNAKIKEATSGATGEATADKLKEAQDLVRCKLFGCIGLSFGKRAELRKRNEAENFRKRLSLFALFEMNNQKNPDDPPAAGASKRRSRRITARRCSDGRLWASPVKSRRKTVAAVAGQP
jgi:hypothetical protein